MLLFLNRQEGKPAEEVADNGSKLNEFLGTDGAIDKYLADQLLLPLSFAEGESVVRTSQVTQHLMTNRDVIQKFLPIHISIQEETQSGLIRISASGNDY
jgi:RNA 3'-terminal phosphate cyclase (ATP)